MSALPSRPLGSSGLQVSRFALGSWRTFERVSREQGLAVMVAARDAGISFLDDARYDDELGTAPIPTGYSEVVFGELFRAAGWVRDEVVVANKLWWEFWPEQDAAAEIDGSLERMGLEHIDLIYAMPSPEGLPVAEMVADVAGLIASGRARAWGIGNWSATDLAEAVRVARTLEVPLPVAAQLPYSVAAPEWVDDPAMQAVLVDGDVGLVASFVLAGGALTGKYLRGEAGRATADGTRPDEVGGRRRAEALVALADEWQVSSTSLAFSFALAHPRLASVLFGATTPEQLRENVASLEVFHSLSPAQVERLRQVATAPLSDASGDTGS